MGKTKWDVYNSEFRVEKGEKKRDNVFLEIRISPEERDNNLNVDLSRMEWNNFVKFMECTKDKKYLPKDCKVYKGFSIDFEAYSSFSIDENKVGYFSSKFNLFMTQAFIDSIKINSKADRLYIERNIALTQRRNRDVKGKLLDANITLSHGKVSITLSRRKFIRFRTFVLNAHKHLFGSRL